MPHSANDVWTRTESPPSSQELLLIAKSMVAARRALQAMLPAGFVHDPAVEILLNLYVAYEEGGEIMADALYERLSVTKSVAQRWIKALIAVDLIADDLSLSRRGIDRMTATLTAIRASQATLLQG